MNMIIRLVMAVALLSAAVISTAAGRAATEAKGVPLEFSAAKKKSLKDSAKAFDDKVRDNSVTANEQQSLRRTRSSAGQAQAGSSSAGMKKK